MILTPIVFIAVYIIKPMLYVLCILSTSIAALFIGVQMKKQYSPILSSTALAQQKPNTQNLQELYHG